MFVRSQLENGNVARPEEFSQVCVWQGTIVGEDSIEKFEKHIEEKLHARCFYLEEILTNPGEGGEGGRNDIFFAVHNDDVGKFAVPRLAYGIRWIEDVFGNGSGPLYPARVSAYKTWDCGDGSQQIEDACVDSEEEEQASSNSGKPRLKIVGANGNIFNILGLAKQAAKLANMDPEYWNRIEKAVLAADSYEHALTILTNSFEVE